jgi:pSer/pThr/pTyr-binding forkhead associated (FHA) protein
LTSPLARSPRNKLWKEAATSEIPSFHTLHFHLLKDNLIIKSFNLVNNQHIEIGRHIGIRTIPAENNGYFDSPVLNRWHAEILEEDGTIFIKDLGSRYGTYINGVRLDPSWGRCSRLYQLKSGDLLAFGSNVFGKDGTIIHQQIIVSVTLASVAPIATYSYSHQHVASPCRSNSIMPRRGSRAGRKIQEQRAAEHDPQIYIPILMRAVKFLASLVIPISILSGEPAWDLESFDQILKGRSDIAILQPQEISALLQHVFPP